MDLTEAQKADRARWEASCELLAALPGAQSLVAKYGRVPTFHDGEVELVHLSKSGPSKLSIAINWPDIFGSDQIVVTLTARTVLDLALSSFSRQNVIDELWFRGRRADPDKEIEDGDLEIELESIVGIGGTVVMRGVELSWKLRKSLSKQSRT